MIKRTFIGISVLVILMMIGVVCNSNAAGFADLPHDERVLDIGLTSDKRDQNVDVAAVVPFYNGYAGAIVSQGFQEGVLDAQTIVTRVQNGIRYKGIGLEGFLDAEFDQVKGVNTHEAGGFVRPGIVKAFGISASSGFGTYVENQTVRADLGLTDVDPQVLPRLLAFVSAKYDAIPNTTLSALIKIAPAYSFDEVKYSVDATIGYDFSDKVGLAKTIHWEKDSDPIVESAGQNYQLTLNARIKL